MVCPSLGRPGHLRRGAHPPRGRGGLAPGRLPQRRPRPAAWSFLGSHLPPQRAEHKPEAAFLGWHGREVFKGAARHLE
jgi:hypothetical protein